MQFRACQWLRPILVLAVLLVAPAALALTQSINTREGSGITIKVFSPFDRLPAYGFAPMTIQIANESGRDGTWQIAVVQRLFETTQTASFSLSVAAGETRDQSILAPLAGSYSEQRGYVDNRITVVGPGVAESAHSVSWSGYSVPFIAITEPLGSLAWSKLQAQLKSSSGGVVIVPGLTETSLTSARWPSGRNQNRELFGTLLPKLEAMPADVRAFSGLSGLWLSAEDWRSLSGPRRSAVLQWIQEGGNLFVAQLEPSPAPLIGLPAELGSDPKALGLGNVRLAKMDGKELSIPELARDYLNLDGASFPPWQRDFSGSWTLPQLVGAPTLNIPLVITFVVVFGIIIGPVNLLVLAPPAKRFRLFITVPAIALLACVFLLLIITAGDGVGADGARNILLYVPAGENRLSLFQEQSVRTRFLLSRNFQLSESVAANAIRQDAGDESESYSYRRRRNRDAGARTFMRSGTSASGDWFRTRAVQSHFLRYTLPSRSEVVLRPSSDPEEAPQLLSTIPTPLRNVFYVDAQRRIWRTKALETGRPARLEPSSESDLAAWGEQAARQLSLGMREQWKASLARPGFFFAETVPTDENTIATLSTIRWQHQQILCFGSCIPATVP